MATYLTRTLRLSDNLSTRGSKMEVNLRDVACPICRGILIEPVTLPCHHNLCLHCVKASSEHNRLNCPLCRVRVGSWLRAATKSKTLVNGALWKLIKTRFPKEVEEKRNGEEEEEAAANVASDLDFAPKAYEARLRIVREEALQRREKERFVLGDGESARTQEHPAEKVVVVVAAATAARKRGSGGNAIHGAGGKTGPGCSGARIRASLGSQESRLPVDVSGGGDESAGTEARVARSGDDERIGSAESAGSHDSINQEIHHFKPIRPIARTTLKMSQDGRPLDPKLIRVTPIVKRVPNAVPKAPSPTRVRRIRGCGFTAFRVGVGEYAEPRGGDPSPENPAMDRIVATNDVPSPRRRSPRPSDRISEVGPAETSGDDDRGTRLADSFDANENYAKSLPFGKGGFVDAARVSNKLMSENEGSDGGGANGAASTSGGNKPVDPTGLPDRRSPLRSNPKDEDDDDDDDDDDDGGGGGEKEDKSRGYPGAGGGKRSSVVETESTRIESGKRRRRGDASTRTRARNGAARGKMPAGSTNSERLGDDDGISPERREPLDAEAHLGKTESRESSSILQEKKDFELAKRLQAQFNEDIEAIGKRTRASRRAVLNAATNRPLDSKINGLNDYSLVGRKRKIMEKATARVDSSGKKKGRKNNGKRAAPRRANKIMDS